MASFDDLMTAPPLRRGEKRRRVTGRTLRHAALRSLCAALPPLERRLHFPVCGVSMDRAGALLRREDRTQDNPLTPEDAAYVAERCAPFETVWRADYPTAPLRFIREAFAAEGCLLTRTGQITTRERRPRVISALGAAPDHKTARAHRIASTRRLDGLLLAAPNSNNYWHFFDDFVLPALAHVEDGVQPSIARLILPPRPHAYVARLATALAQAWKIPIESTGPAERVEGTFLLWRQARHCSEWLDVTPDAAAALRRVLRGALDAPPDPGFRGLYLDRGKGARGLRDADGLAALLSRVGMLPFEARGDAVAAQVSAFGGARTVLAVHGAGLANLLFCEPRARIVEILPTDLRKSSFRMLARQLGHDYAALEATEGGFRERLAVDFLALERLLTDR